MKIYKVTKINRWNREFNKITYYANEAKAMEEVAKVKATYEEAKAKGDGSHWGKIEYDRAYIEEINVIE